MKTILVPTDFSEIADSAVLFAMQIASKIDAKIVLLHTYNYPLVDPQNLNISVNYVAANLDLVEFEEFKNNKKHLHDKAFENGFENIEMTHRLVLGELNSTIKECITEEKIDLLVMGTNGEEDWFTKLLGSNADSVMLNVNIPVLILHDAIEIANFENIGFATRFRAKDKIFLNDTIHFAEQLNINVKCFHVLDNNEEVLNDTKAEWEKEFGNKVTFHLHPDTDVVEAIDFMVNHHQVDILAMVTYKRDFLTELFTKRLTQKIAHKLKIPILVYHA